MQTIAQTASSGTAPPLAHRPIADQKSVSDRLSGLERLFEAHHDRVFRAAYRVTGNTSDAEDVLQTVFLRLLRGGHDFERVEDAGNYLHRAGVNAALDVVRAKKPGIPLEDHIADDPLWSPDRGHHPPQLREQLRAAVAQLHPTAAEMFVLRYFDGYDNGEVARIMNTSEGTVAVTLHRTRVRLQKELGGIR